MTTRPAVEVTAADPAWPARFAAERPLLAAALPEARAIEHVGSTSVPGLPAKPTIDIMAVVDDPAATVRERGPALARLGYDHRPGSFPDDTRHVFLRKVDHGVRTHHLHLVAADSPLPDDYRAFRAYLTGDPDAAARYAAVKQELAERYADRRQRYVDLKAEYVDGLMAEARRRRRSADGGGESG